MGDFDGDGRDDLITFQNDTFFVRLRHQRPDRQRRRCTIAFGFPGVCERPVVADMNQDGIDDFGVCPGQPGPDARRDLRVVLPGLRRPDLQ